MTIDYWSVETDELEYYGSDIEEMRAALEKVAESRDTVYNMVGKALLEGESSAVVPSDKEAVDGKMVVTLTHWTDDDGSDETIDD